MGPPADPLIFHLPRLKLVLGVDISTRSESIVASAGNWYSASRKASAVLKMTDALKKRGGVDARFKDESLADSASERAISTLVFFAEAVSCFLAAGHGRVGWKGEVQ